MKQTMKKILKKWQLWYWALVFVWLSPYILNQEEFRGVIGFIYFVLYACPIFLLINIVLMLIKNKSAVIKNWRFWIWIILLSLNVLLILPLFIASDESILIFLRNYINNFPGPASEPEHAVIQSPVGPQKIDFCKEGTRGNNCIKCSCNSVEDCKLVTSPYVISECAKTEAVSKSTTESCLDEVRIMAIHATCVVSEDYQPPEYEVVCANNTCGKIEK